MQNLIDRYFESLGVVPRIAMEVENNEAIKSLVRAGLGASIMPLCAVAKEPPGRPPRFCGSEASPLLRELRLLSADSEILPNAIQRTGFRVGGRPGAVHEAPGARGIDLPMPLIVHIDQY